MNINGLKTCKVCGRDFPLIIENHYIARKATTTGLSIIVEKKEPSLFDAFDCPHCGCQNIMNVREYSYDDDCEEEEEEHE